MLLCGDTVSIELVSGIFDNGFTWTHEHDQIAMQLGLDHHIFGISVATHNLKYFGKGPDDAD